MNFFKIVFLDDTTPPDSPKSPTTLNPTDGSDDPNPTSTSTSSPVWSFGGLIKTLATKSESMIDNYRRDFEEFGSGLRRETAVIRQAASVSLEAGASVAQESLETVGQAIDDIGATVWKSTAQIISHGRDSILDHDHDSDSSNIDSSYNVSRRLSLDVKRYSRFDMQLHAIRCDLNTYCTEPEDREEYEKWRSELFVVDQKKEEIESLLGENSDIRGIYDVVVPSRVDGEGFWSRYFYRVHKLKQAEEARAKLVQRAISGEEDEDLSWDFDDDDDIDGEEGVRGLSSRDVELRRKNVENNSPEGNAAEEDKIEISSGRLSGADRSDDSSEKNEDKGVVVEGKGDNGGSCKDSDVSVVSSQSLLPEEEDLGWDEIEDIGSNDESKGQAAGSITSASRVDLHKRLSSAEEEEDLSWDIEDEDDEPGKP